MRAVVQRVKRAEVRVLDEVVGSIGKGLCVLVGVTHSDDDVLAKKLATKLWNLRLLDDENGVANLSIAHTSKEILIISQFTLYGDTNSGRRPSWIAAAKPDHAEPLIHVVVNELRALGATVATGRFRTEMAVELVNDGPFTVIIDV
jgi:D-aminoacyl-tRNA deacylase